MTAVHSQPAPPGDPDEEHFEHETQRLALGLAEDVLSDPLRGSALLRGAAMVMAYLASHDNDPPAALQLLVNEMVGNAQHCLAAMTASQVGNA